MIDTSQRLRITSRTLASLSVGEDTLADGDKNWYCYPQRLGRSTLICGRKQSRWPFHCLVGPDWRCMLFTYIVILLPSILFLIYVTNSKYYKATFITTLLLAVVLFFLCATTCGDPGIVYGTLLQSQQRVERTRPNPPIEQPHSPGSNSNGGSLSRAENGFFSPCLSHKPPPNSNRTSPPEHGNLLDTEIENSHAVELAKSHISNERCLSEVGKENPYTPPLPSPIRNLLNTAPAAVPSPVTSERVSSSRHNLTVCGACRVLRGPNAVHCRDCGICIEGLDHHCPWMGKCVGEKTLWSFYCFLASLALLVPFMAACLIFPVLLRSL